MCEYDIDEFFFDDYDELCDLCFEDNGFDVVVDVVMLCRGFFGGVVVFGFGVVVMGIMFFVFEVQVVNCFGFVLILMFIVNIIMLFEGYEWDVLVKWGQFLWFGMLDVD